MKSHARASAAGLGVALVLSASLAGATSKVPVSFDPTLGAKPAETQQKLTALEGKLPAGFALAPSLKSVTTGALTLTFFPETALQLGRARTASGTMTWPTTPALCVKHAAFVAPGALLASGAAPSCSATETSVRALLADTGVCRAVEEPESYVSSYTPAQVDDTTTASIESLIGLAGEALSHHPAPGGLLPADWVPMLRSVLWKIRRSPIDAQIAKAHASYTQIQSTLTSQAACFDATTRASLAKQLTDLDAELQALTAHLDALAAADLATAQHELVCMAAHSRTRAALPFPSLTRPEREAVAFWLGGIYWRMRGGGLVPTGSTQKARTYFLQRPFQRIAELTGGTAIGNDLGTAIYLNIFDGWGEWMDMGTTPGGQDLYEDLVDMTDRGRHQVQDNPVIPGTMSATRYLDPKGYETTNLLLGGLDMGPCYAYALGELKDFRYADTAPAPYGPFIEYFTAVGEFCTGASIALGMAKTLLDGVPSGKPTATLCLGRTCGDDGCGGSCGSCAGGATCNASGTCVTACVPACSHEACGEDDGCGGHCPGSCGAGAAPPAGASPEATGVPPGTSGCGCRSAGSKAPSGPGGLVLAALHGAGLRSAFTVAEARVVISPCHAARGVAGSRPGQRRSGRGLRCRGSARGAFAHHHRS